MAIPKRLQAYLKKKKLSFTPVAHRTVYTAYDVAQTLHVKLSDVVKTLVVRADGNLVLAVLPADKRLDLKKMQKALKAKKLELVTERLMEKRLSVAAGAVTPFGGFHGLPVVCDRSIKTKAKPVFGAGSFTDSIRLASGRYLSAEKPILTSITEARKPSKTKKGKKR